MRRFFRGATCPSIVEDAVHHGRHWTWCVEYRSRNKKARGRAHGLLTRSEALRSSVLFGDGAHGFESDRLLAAGDRDGEGLLVAAGLVGGDEGEREDVDRLLAL